MPTTRSTWPGKVRRCRAARRSPESAAPDGYPGRTCTLRGGADAGFALLGEKTLKKKWTITGGYTQIDPRYGNVNADRVFQGKHLYGLLSYQLTPEIAVGVFTSRILDEPRQPVLPVRVRSEVFVRYNLLKALQRAGWVK